MALAAARRTLAAARFTLLFREGSNFFFSALPIVSSDYVAARRCCRGCKCRTACPRAKRKTPEGRHQ
eukprot:7497490-Pyramimonas_sp.AAC.1